MINPVLAKPPKHGRAAEPIGIEAGIFRDPLES